MHVISKDTNPVDRKFMLFPNRDVLEEPWPNRLVKDG